jgi:uncharacterized protein
MKTKLPKKSAFMKPLLDDFTKEAVKAYPDKLLGVILFGSYARGDFRADSDVDIMLLFDNSFQYLQKDDAIFDLILDYILEQKMVIIPLALQKKLFTQRKTTLYHNVQREGILLWKKPLKTK